VQAYNILYNLIKGSLWLLIISIQIEKIGENHTMIQGDLIGHVDQQTQIMVEEGIVVIVEMVKRFLIEKKEELLI